MITRELVKVNDGAWMRETDSANPSLVCYTQPTGPGGMFAVRDPSGYWYFFDVSDALAHGFDFGATLHVADERWANRSDNDIPF